MDRYKNIATILYVEDEDGVRRGFAKAIGRYAKVVYEACDGQEGLELYKKYLPDVVITDIKMPKMSGIEMAKKIKEINPEQAIIVTSAHSESEYLLEAIRLQLSGYVLKPVDKNILKRKVLDIVKHQQIQTELDNSIVLMSEITNLQNNMLIVFDELNRIIFVNQMFLKLFIVKNVAEFKKKYKCLCNVLIEHRGYYTCEEQKDGFWSEEFENLRDDKRVVSIMDYSEMTPKAFLVNIKRIEETKHKICTFTEITTLATKKNEFEKKAYIDELTKIYNRAKFNEVLLKEVINTKISGDGLSLIFFDVDHFKKFNDTYGHQVGDNVLSGLASLIKNSLRDSDFFARWGGEEFVILLPGVKLKSAKAIAEHKRKIIQDYTFDDNLKVTCSFGVVSMLESDDKDSLLKRADEALYKAKDSGRNCVVSQ